jgi:hypothetical protein
LSGSEIGDDYVDNLRDKLDKNLKRSSKRSSRRSRKLKNFGTNTEDILNKISDVRSLRNFNVGSCEHSLDEYGNMAYLNRSLENSISSFIGNDVEKFKNQLSAGKRSRSNQSRSRAARMEANRLRSSNKKLPKY